MAEIIWMDDASFVEYANEVTGYIASYPILQEWPECQRTLLEMMAVDEPWLLALPILSCLAVGGELSDGVPVAAAWASMRHAANLLDDVQDGAEVRTSVTTTPAEAISCATGMVFVAYQILQSARSYSGSARRIIKVFSEAGFHSSLGQFLGLAPGNNPLDDSDRLEEYWNTVLLKSGSVYQAGTAGGAAAGTDSDQWISALGDYGNALGVIRQVLDDCRDIIIDSETMKHKAPLPLILRSLVIHHPENQERTDAIIPGKRQSKDHLFATLEEAEVPEIIATVLLEWRRRALDSLQIFEVSKNVVVLEGIVEQILKQKPFPT